MTVYRNPPNMAIILVVGILGGPHPRYTFLSSQFWCDIMGSIHLVARELRVHLHSLPPKNSRAMHMGFNPRLCVLVSRLDFSSCLVEVVGGSQTSSKSWCNSSFQMLEVFPHYYTSKNQQFANSRKPSQKERIVFNFQVLC